MTTTTTQYDALGRVVSVGYDDNLTPTKQYFYDAGNWAEASSQQYLKRRLSLAKTSKTGTLYSYDPMGRVNQTWQCTPSGCGNSAYDKLVSYTYDWAGNMTSQFDPAAGNITYGRSPAGEITSVTNQTYTLSGASGSATLLSNASNGPNGPISYNFGNGLSQATSYDSVGRINGSWLCIGSPSNGCPNQRDGFALNWSGARISSYTEDYLGRTTGDLGYFTPQYDDFNRLSALTQKTSGPYSSSWSQTFGYVYDRYGNRWAQNAPQGGPSFSQSYNAANNQLSSGGYTYDAAGNMTYDATNSHHYTYDAEGNILQVDSGSTASYVYDALNRRASVKISSGETDSLFDLAGRITSNWSSATTANESHIFADGMQIAFRSNDGQTYFNHKDWLNTDRVHTDLNGATAAIYTSLPFGDGSTDTINEGPGGWDFARFGNMDDDWFVNTYHAQFREYSQAQAHWMSPDAYDGSYDPSNPQSFNRYSYVFNNPLSFTDPSGLLMQGSSPGECGWCSAFGQLIVQGFSDLFSLFGSGPSFHGSIHPRPSTGQMGDGYMDADGVFHPYQTVTLEGAPGWLRNGTNFSGWVTGTLGNALFYGPSTAETKQMMATQHVLQFTSSYVEGGCQPNAAFNQPSQQAFNDSWASGNATEWQVGGYLGAVNSENGNTTFTITNNESMSSFFGLSALAQKLNQPWLATALNHSWGPMHDVWQTFQWSEVGLCP